MFVTRLDTTGITQESYRLGRRIARLSHDFSTVDGGTLYVSCLVAGTTVPVLPRILNALAHRTPFTEAVGCAWLKHNVEGVGLLEYIIPLLHPQRP